MDAKQQAEKHDDIEKRLRDASESWEGLETVGAEEAKGLVDASISFIEDQFQLMVELLEKFEVTDAQRQFYAQVLVAISKYKGPDATAMPLMALIATADSLPREDKGGG